MASGLVTKEIETRLKQSPEHIFEVFLAIHQPINQEVPEILIKYPNNFSDEILKTVANFAYPCQTPSDDQSENFTFVILDSTGLRFRFGYCRRSNRDSTCLCLISYYPWFEMFYSILNDLSRIINLKSVIDGERFLSLLYNYKLLSIKEFYKNEGKEIIEITSLLKYSRPDQRQLPSMLSDLNFTVMFSRLSSDIMLRLFAHLLFERRILFVSSKLFHLTACACGCLYLINPLHWQSIFLPILPESLIWTTQCSAPYIIGIHSSTYSRMNKDDLGDAVIVNIDERTIESEYEDLNFFPKYLIRKMKKDIQQSSQLIGDHLARVFLRTMVFILGNYAAGFVIKNGKLDYDREVFLRQYIGLDLYTFMSSIANTQMFEQFSRYRTYNQLEREIEIDEFDMEVKNLQPSKKPKNNQKNHKTLEKTSNPLIEPVQKTFINQTEQPVVDEAISVVNTPILPDVNDDGKQKFESNEKQENPNRLSLKLDQHYQVNLDTDKNLLLPSPIVLNEVKTSRTNEIPRPIPPIDSKIRQLQSELQHKIQTFDNKRLNPRDEYGEQQKEIKKLVQQFDPHHDATPVIFRSDINLTDRHPSLQEIIPTNCVNNIRKNLQTNT